MRDSETHSKLDAALRMRIQDASKNQMAETLHCLVKLNGPVEEHKKQQLEKAGVRIITVTKEILTVEASADAIRRIASYDFVHSIALSQQRYPQKK